MTKLASVFLFVSCAVAQDNSVRIQFDWSKLAAKATENVDVSLEGPTLQLASQFLSSSDNRQAGIQKIVSGLKGVYVRSLEFDKEGLYTQADLDGIRAQLRPPQWAKIVDVKEKGGDNVGVYLNTDGKQTQGIVVLAAEPKELTFVQIVGLIDPSMLGSLGGTLGIPKMTFGPKAPTASKKKQD